MLPSEIIGPARVFAKDPLPGTYSNDAYLALLDLICLDVITRVKFPFARIATGTIAGQQEYLLPETPIDDGTGSVYLNGQLLTKTSVATLEGHQINYYDQSGFGTQQAGSGGPPSNAGQYVPQWTVQPQESFPVPNARGMRNFAAPWSKNSAPRYYLRGGFIGIVPAPSMSASLDTEGNVIPNLVLDMCISNAYLGPYTWNAATVQPRALTTMNSRIWYPNIYKNLLVWGLVNSIAASDDTQMTKEARNNAGQMYRDQIDEMRFWSKSYRGDNQIKMQTNRGRYIGRWNRRRYGGGYP